MAKKVNQRRPGRGSDQFIVRFPEGIRDDIAEQAQQNGRSMNAEIVARLGTSFQSFLSQEGLVAVSKRLESAATAFEELYFGVRDRPIVDGGGQMSSATWTGFLRLSLVTCPVRLYAATSGPSLPGSKTDDTIEIDRFVPRNEFDPLYIRDFYYLAPEGKVGHDAFAVIRETIHATNKVALARIEAGNRKHVIALEARDTGMLAMLLRQPNEVRESYFEGIQDVHVTKEMLDLARHIVEPMSGHFGPEMLAKDRAPADRSAKPPPTNVINLLEALRKSAA